MAPDLLQEASDPSTAPERLRELGLYHDQDVQRAAWKNPSLPEDVWRTVLLGGKPEAWANPMTPIYLLAWTPREDDPSTPEYAAPFATQALWDEPDRCCPEGKALLAAKVQEWWATSEDSEVMIRFLGWWAQAKGDDSTEHREVVRITVLCVRTAPDLTASDLKALDLLEAWCAGGADRRYETKALISSQAVTDTALFAQSSFSPWNAVYEMLSAVGRMADNEAKDEQSSMLADLIRRERPLPPVAE
jgi:hypothetical protein